MNFYVLPRWMTASQPLIAKNRFRTRPDHARFLVDKVALWQVSLPTLRFTLSVPFHQCSIPIHSPITHTIQCFSPSTSVFPCQYHSTNAPYPFIHLPPTLYNVSLPALQFSPVSTIPPMLHSYHMHLNTALTRRTSGCCLGTSKCNAVGYRKALDKLYRLLTDKY